MSDQDYGVLLHDAEDVLPLGLVGTPWEIIFNALRDVLKSGVGSSDSDFMRKACALYFLARGDLDAVTDRDVLNGIAAALVIPYWVENFDDPTQASAIIYNWIKYKPTRPNLTALALASGMRAFRLRETYTSTEYGLSHSFGFDLGEGYDTSFFAGPNATPGLETAQRICGALTHFFLRIKDSPTLITDITYPEALPHGAQFYFRPDQSEIRILQGYNWDLYDENGELAQKIDEYAYYIPSVTRNSYGVNTEIVPPTHLIFLSDGQIRVSWEQSPTSAYALFAEVGINIPDKTRGWLSLSHVDVNLPPNAIPGAVLYDEEGDPITGEGWEIFAAYNQALDRLDTSDLYLAGTDPVRIRADRYMTVCQVWLSYTPPPPPPLDDRTTFIVVDETTGTIVHSIVDEGLVFGDVGYVLMDDSQMITVYETGVQTESFYFTTNGRNETANTDISHSDIPVYLEDGTAPAADTPYNGSTVLAFMDVDGNTKQADGESLYLDDGVLRLDAPDTDEGEQWAALVEYIEPAPTLPTVSTSGDFGNNNWLYANTQGADVTVASGNSTLVGLAGQMAPTAVSYDATKAYAVINWSSYQSASGSGRAEFSIVDSSGNIYAQNNSSGSLKLYALRCAVCSDSMATVITVYSSADGTAYNAFKYTASGTDYYYVLDETQIDWTDDLSNIGYSLEPPAPSFDSATGTISGLTLPSAHSGSYTNVTFDALRYYVKGTVQWLNSTTGAFFGLSSQIWYHGTIVWTDESLGDLSSLIQVNPTSSSNLVQQTVFRILFITSGVGGYHPYDTGDSSVNYNQITAYSYNNGTHSITFYTAGSNWWGYSDTGRIQFRYLDGTTTFNGLDAYDLILVNNGVLSKATTTDRYDMYNTYNGDITIHAEY